MGLNVHKNQVDRKELMQNNNYNSFKMILWDIVVLLFTVFLDQIAKSWARVQLSKQTIVLIDGVLEFHYLENGGAAFGMLQGKTPLFLLIAIVMFLVISFIIYHIPADKKFVPLNFSLVLILSGGVGNSIDRIVKGTVTDFIYFRLIDFPVFNLADIYITCSTVWLVLLILFVYKDAELNFLKKDTK